MKKILFLSTLLLSLSLWSFGQDSQKMPIDPNVRYGKLDNGLTYYIRHNAYPEQRASFYIAQKVGSMQEEDSQQGLAHFLEHMAFNGTKNFPGRKSMLDYMEKQGARFGKDVNAYTSFDETVYNLKDIPVVREGVIDSSLLILHDWSSFITLDNDEIDKERSIIKEEWRNRTDANFRIWDKTLPVLFEGSKYADRLPIGKMEIVENFDYQTLKDYYHKWYRPDLQAIIVVGDIDVDKVEEKIKTMFADIPKPVNPAERIYYPVVDNDEPIVSIATDKEKTSTEVYLFFKQDVMPPEVRATHGGYRTEVIYGLISNMLSARLSEIAQKPESPYSYAYGYKSNYFVAQTKDAWTLLASAKEGMAQATLKVLAEENERMKRFGFTEAELERAKASLMTSYENSYNNRNKQQSVRYVEEYKRSFTTGEPIPGMEYEYTLIQQLLPSITVNDVNKIAENLSSDKNIVISVNGVEKEGLTYPTNSDLANIVNTVRHSDIQPYTEEAIAENLLNKEPVAGTIVKEEKNDKLGSTLWTLSNGAKVALKKTDFKDDQILMTATSHWGSDFYPDSEIYNISRAAAVAELGGMGDLSITDLRKFFAGKAAGAGAYISPTTTGLNGSSNIKDLETLFQVIYMRFTAPRKDQEAYEAYIEQTKNSLKNAELDPYTAFDDSITFALHKNNPRFKRMRLEDVDKLDYDRMLEMYKESFSDAGTFTFSFVGTIDEDAMRPLVEKYIASLPSVPRRAATELPIGYRDGIIINRFEKEMENPKASVFNLYRATVEKNQKNDLTAQALNFILNIEYIDKVREEMGGTYDVGTYLAIRRKPKDMLGMQINFETEAAKANDLNELVHRVLKEIAENGPDKEKFEKAKGQIQKSFEENVKQNNYWLNILNTIYYYGEDNYSSHTDVLNSITPDDVQNLCKKIVDNGNMIEVIMLPKAD